MSQTIRSVAGCLCLLALLAINVRPSACSAVVAKPVTNGTVAAPVTNGTVAATLNGTSATGKHHMERFPFVVEDFSRVETPFIISMWIFLACLGKIGFHMTPKVSKMFPESCMLIVLGFLIGLLLFYTHAASVSPLTANVFFIYMLPPIILDAGYFMPNRLFFDHLGTILMFAVLGTIWNVLSIGISLYALSLTNIFGMQIPVLHILVFSSLICAVDPVAVLAVFEEIHVEEVLFILVFGESLLNDGITVVLYHMFEGFSILGQDNLILQDYIAAIVSFFLVAVGGTAIGIIWGFLAAFVTRFTYGVRVIEPLFIFVMSYLSYLNAEIFHLSGILAITFCGITMKNYTTQNISRKSQTTVKYTMKMLASSSETIIFMFLGVATVHPHHEWNTWFVFFTILFCSVYRVIGTLIMSAICNTFRVQKISFVQKFVISYGGLRGAVAFALVLTIDKDYIPAQPMFVTTTIAVVYFTVFVQGITIKPLVALLGVKKANKRHLTMNERLHERIMDYLMAGVEDVIGKHGNFYLRDKFKRFNTKYLTPFLVREEIWSEPKLLETLKDIKMDEAMNYMANQGHPPEQIESFAALFRTAHMAHAGSMKSDQMQPGEFWNLDVAELEYNPTAKDINEANFHHLLSDEHKPVKSRQKHRATYKRHAVTEEEVGEPNHRNQPMRLRKAGHFRHYSKQREEQNGTAGGSTVKTNGSAITLKNDYIAERMKDNPAFTPDDSDPASYGVQMRNKPCKRMSVKGPVVAETTLPWRRHLNAEPPTSATKVQRRTSIDFSNEHTPTMAEMLLPWRRVEDEGEAEAPRQSEQPAWASNEDYIDTDSPSHTYLRKIGEDPKPSAQEVFRKRNSTASMYSIDESSNGLSNLFHAGANKLIAQRRAMYKKSTGDLRRNSLKSEAYWRDIVSDTARRGMTMNEKGSSEPSTRRNSLREQFDNESPIHVASLLNTAITEEEAKTPSPKASRAEYVINMEPVETATDKQDKDETRF